jgi:pimeloyl-ACP methyl ester carboxylesterase
VDKPARRGPREHRTGHGPLVAAVTLIELVVFEHNSHVPHLEKPERFLQVLRDFLNRTEAAPAAAV